MSSESRRRTIEWIKTVVIAVLAISAVLLGWQTRLFNDFIGTIPVFRGAAEFIKGTPPAFEEGTGTVTKEAARPAGIVITDVKGGHYGVKYDKSEINMLYMRTSSIFAEALGDSATLTEVGEEVWREALVSPGVYFEYTSRVKLSILCGWFGSRANVREIGVTVRRICVTFNDGVNRIYLEDEETGLFYAASAESSGGRTIELGMYTENGAKFAFETGLAAAENAPYKLLLPGSEHPVIRVTEAEGQQEVLDAVLLSLGTSNQIKPSYSASDGALIYVGAGFRVRVDTKGRASLTRAEDFTQETAEEPGEGKLIERARTIAADTIAQSSGDAEVHFEEGFYSDDGSYTVTFYYRVSGGRIVSGNDGYAARFVFKGGTLISMELNFRRYEVTGDKAVLLPERQALAAAGGEFLLCYMDTGTSYLRPDWYPAISGEI